MRARLVKIGNSRGVRLPKTVIEEAGLTDDVDVRVRGGVIEIASANTPRAGWAEAAKRLRADGRGRLLDPEIATAFDQTEWTW